VTRPDRLVGIFAMVLAALATVTLAHAAPEEIQVYMNEFADPGAWGLDVHTNYVGSLQPNAGNTPPPSRTARKMLRTTPELSYGINKNWEVAGYFLTSAGPEQASGHLLGDGVKARVKWRPDWAVNAEKNGSPWYAAINFEMGQLAQRFNAEQQVGQLKLIGMWRQGNWTVGGNLNFDRTLKGPSALGTTTELDVKLAYRLSVLGALGSQGPGTTQIGIEQYAYRGALSGAYAGQNRNKAIFLALDFEVNKWEVNLGVGRATGVIDDKLIVKAVIGVPF
jgi:hypothetical protein